MSDTETDTGTTNPQQEYTPSGTANPKQSKQPQNITTTSGGVGPKLWEKSSSNLASEEYVQTIHQDLTTEINRLDGRLTFVENEVSDIGNIEDSLEDLRESENQESEELTLSAAIYSILFRRPLAPLYAFGIVLFIIAFEFSNPLVAVAGATVLIGSTLHYAN